MIVGSQWVHSLHGSSQKRGLLSVNIGFSFAHCCSAEMSVSLVIVASFAVSFALRSAPIARLILTLLSCTRLVPTLIPCTRASPTTLNSVRTPFEVPYEHLPYISIAVHRLQILWSLHAPFFFVSLVLQGTSEPSCALSLSSQARLSSAQDLQHWTWRLHCCFAGTGHQHVLDITVNFT